MHAPAAVLRCWEGLQPLLLTCLGRPCPAGDAEAPAAEQWKAAVELNEALLAAAPEDEVMAEMLALQARECLAGAASPGAVCGRSKGL